MPTMPSVDINDVATLAVPEFTVNAVAFICAPVMFLLESITVCPPTEIPPVTFRD